MKSRKPERTGKYIKQNLIEKTGRPVETGAIQFWMSMMLEYEATAGQIKIVEFQETTNRMVFVKIRTCRSSAAFLFCSLIFDSFR